MRSLVEIHAASQIESWVLGWPSEESLCSQSVIVWTVSTRMLARLESGDLVDVGGSLVLGEAPRRLLAMVC